MESAELVHVTFEGKPRADQLSQIQSHQHFSAGAVSRLVLLTSIFLYYKSETIFAAPIPLSTFKWKLRSWKDLRSNTFLNFRQKTVGVKNMLLTFKGLCNTQICIHGGMFWGLPLNGLYNMFPLDGVCEDADQLLHNTEGTENH